MWFDMPVGADKDKPVGNPFQRAVGAWKGAVDGPDARFKYFSKIRSDKLAKKAEQDIEKTFGRKVGSVRELTPDEVAKADGRKPPDRSKGEGVHVNTGSDLQQTLELHDYMAAVAKAKAEKDLAGRQKVQELAVSLERNLAAGRNRGDTPTRIAALLEAYPAGAAVLALVPEVENVLNGADGKNAEQTLEIYLGKLDRLANSNRTPEEIAHDLGKFVSQQRGKETGPLLTVMRQSTNDAAARKGIDHERLSNDPSSDPPKTIADVAKLVRDQQQLGRQPGPPNKAVSPELADEKALGPERRTAERGMEVAGLGHGKMAAQEQDLPAARGSTLDLEMDPNTELGRAVMLDAFEKERRLERLFERATHIVEQRKSAEQELGVDPPGPAPSPGRAPTVAKEQGLGIERGK